MPGVGSPAHSRAGLNTSAMAGNLSHAALVEGDVPGGRFLAVRPVWAGGRVGRTVVRAARMVAGTKSNRWAAAGVSGSARKLRATRGSEKENLPNTAPGPQLMGKLPR